MYCVKNNPLDNTRFESFLLSGKPLWAPGFCIFDKGGFRVFYAGILERYLKFLPSLLVV